MPGNLDLFNFLSDSLLILIISFLPFKDAAMTSILSRRWRYIWHSTKNIEFNESSFMKHHLLAGDGRQAQKQAFIDYARKWMIQYQEPKVDRFRLSFSSPNEFHSDIEQWIRAVINLNVQEVDLRFYWLGWEGSLPPDHKATFDIPSCLYEHGTLQSLNLAACNLEDSLIKNFTSLKNLSLECVVLSTMFCKNLFSNCPSLESLSLKKCLGLYNVNLYGRTATQMKKLFICDCSPHRSSINISIPSLTFFKYSGSIRNFLLQGLTSIEEADLDFGLAYVNSDQFRTFLHRILRGLHLVNRLTVCSYVTQVLPNRAFAFFPPPIYLEARHLNIKVGLQARELPGIMMLLMYCPMLDTLSIELGFGRQLTASPFRRKLKCYYNYPSYAVNFKASCRQLEGHLHCLKENLKVIEVDGYQGLEYEEELLQFLLKEAQVLERITLTTSEEMDLDHDEHPDTYFQNAQRVQGFQRASHNLLVSIR